MTTAEAWRELALDTDVIVNAAGALQDGPRDDLSAVHTTAIAALCAAASHGTLFIQISAPDVSPEASTAFYRSKAAGDDAVRASGLPWVMLRPAVVVSRDAYGGTALLRALAAFPGIIPVAYPETSLRCVSIDDVVATVVEAAQGRIPAGSDLDLGEPTERSLAEVLLLFRAWLGLPKAPVRWVPGALAHAVTALADAAGRLGWRSPLRSTAMIVAAGGVSGSPMRPCRSLETTLEDFPATVQELWFARLYLLKPVVLLLLSLFWLASGLIGIMQLPEAAAILTETGAAKTTASLAVLAGATVDLLLGALVRVRRWSAKALVGMIAVTIFYLAAASILTPGLWLDPLGPLVKTLPAAMLAMLALAVDPER